MGFWYSCVQGFKRQHQGHYLSLSPSFSSAQPCQLLSQASSSLSTVPGVTIGINTSIILPAVGLSAKGRRFCRCSK